jgi:hypothetical protein
MADLRYWVSAAYRGNPFVGFPIIHRQIILLDTHITESPLAGLSRGLETDVSVGGIPERAFVATYVFCTTI